MVQSPVQPDAWEDVLITALLLPFLDPTSDLHEPKGTKVV